LESDWTARGTASARVVASDTPASVARRCGQPVNRSLDVPGRSGGVAEVQALFVGGLFAAFCALTLSTRTRFNPVVVIGAK
jgi:hypothetical protein